MSNPWQVNILTLFPELFPGPLGVSVIGRGLINNLWSINAYNIRDYATDKHRTVDDVPYGGGSGMVIRPDVLARGIKESFNANLRTVYLSPRGKLFNQEMGREIAREPGINLVCGRFEGIDERVIEKFNIEEISIGDYVLSSGDLAAYILIDVCLRNIPGILKSPESLQEESFGDANEYRYLLEYPNYTKPALFEGMKVPEVLQTGNHKKVKDWRLAVAKEKTQKVRPDLWQKYTKE